MSGADDAAAAYYEKLKNRDAAGPCHGRRVGVTLTEEHVAAITAAAEAVGVTISAYLRKAGLALAAAQRAGGTASCGHLSMSPVTSAECGTCGVLPVSLTVTR